MAISSNLVLKPVVFINPFFYLSPQLPYLFSYILYVKDQKTSQEKASNWGFSYNLKGWTSLCINPQLQVEGIKV